MTREELKSVDEIITGRFKAFNDVMKSTLTELTSANGMLADVKSDVRVIKLEQEHQGNYIEALQQDMRGVNDQLRLMPDRWQSDIQAAVKICGDGRDKIAEAKERGEVTGVANLVKERELARREGRYTSTAPPRRRDSWLPSAVKDALRPFITFLVAGAIFGVISLAVGRCGNPVDKADLKETQHQVEELRKAIAGVNGGIDGE